MKKCPFCAEEIQDEALKCKHCGEMLNKQSKYEDNADMSEKSLYFIRGHKQNDQAWKPSLSKNVFVKSKELAEKIAFDIIKEKNENITDYKVTVIKPDATRNKVCSTCKSLIEPILKKPGSGLVTFILVWFFLVPAIIYAVWRMASKYYACPKCGSKSLIDINSPEAKKNFAETLR